MITRPAADFSCIPKLLCLLCLLFSAASQAGSSWQTRAAQQLEQLLNKQQNLPELKDPVVSSFYHERKYMPLWSDARGRLNRAYDLFHVIVDAADEGLKASDYHLQEIRRYWGSTDAEDSARLDLLLTAALYSYSNHVYSGRYDPAELDTDWHISNKKLDTQKLFSEIAGRKSIAGRLKYLPPPHSGYKLLKKELQRFRDIKQQGGWKKFKAGPILEPGIQHPQVVQLRQRLSASGDLAECPVCNIDIFDYELADAVKRFQARHGLTADGRVGWQTRRALNIPVSEKILQIRINMERWRWMPRYLGRRYLMVNMTGFELYIMEKGAAVLTIPVIIGKSYRSTPSFSGWVSTMEYNPYWTVPTTIAVEDFLPRQINDPSFLARKSIRLYRGWGENAREVDPGTVDWRKLDKDHFPYWMRQDPGPENALGQMKFLFSNPYEIYLHGTPDKHLFERTVRTFSSGCIRVKDPVRLAAYLLSDGSQQKEEEVLTSIYLGGNQKITLPASMPIYLVYWTAWADQDGNINFRADIYGRDRKLKRLFASP